MVTVYGLLENGTVKEINVNYNKQNKIEKKGRNKK